MKVTLDRGTPTFVPVVLTLTLESQAEVDAIYAIGNINNALSSVISECVINSEVDDKFISTITENLFFNPLKHIATKRS